MSETHTPAPQGGIVLSTGPQDVKVAHDHGKSGKIALLIGPLTVFRTSGDAAVVAHALAAASATPFEVEA